MYIVKETLNAELQKMDSKYKTLCLQDLKFKQYLCFRVCREGKTCACVKMFWHLKPNTSKWYTQCICLLCPTAGDNKNYQQETIWHWKQTISAKTSIRTRTVSLMYKQEPKKTRKCMKGTWNTSRCTRAQEKGTNWKKICIDLQWLSSFQFVHRGESKYAE